MGFTKLVEQGIALATSLDLLGDKWTLLIIASCLTNPRRFNCLEQNLGINRNLLSARLDRLVQHGVLEKQQYQDNPVRHEYVITPAGRNLRPIIVGLVNWGENHLMGGNHQQTLIHKDCGGDLEVIVRCKSCQQPLKQREVRARVSPEAEDIISSIYKSHA